ncbi:hypothetical protein I552_2297 [Mycobacterium xenopi 3993]|nr:hypothetical protein I552_2297 [Mycobacterium xenopi 3993]
MATLDKNARQCFWMTDHYVVAPGMVITLWTPPSAAMLLR